MPTYPALIRTQLDVLEEAYDRAQALVTANGYVCPETEQPILDGLQEAIRAGLRMDQARLDIAALITYGELTPTRIRANREMERDLGPEEAA